VTNQHVVKRSEGWAVRGERNSRDTSNHKTQSEAIAAAKEIARHQHGELIVHDRHGRIRQKDSFGNDPFPPRG
jgi:uncharacterized protein YdaT